MLTDSLQLSDRQSPSESEEACAGNRDFSNARPIKEASELLRTVLRWQDTSLTGCTTEVAIQGVLLDLPLLCDQWASGSDLF